MDPGRYVLQQALEGYIAVHEPDFRAGGSFCGRRVPHGRFPRDSIYTRLAYQGEMLESEIYPPTSASGPWPQSRRRHFDDENGYTRVCRGHIGTFYGLDNFNDTKNYHEIDSFHDVYRFHDRYRHANSYLDVDSYDDYVLERHAGSGTRAHVEDRNNYDLRHRGCLESRENSRERDYFIGWYNYEFDQDKRRRETSWRRHDSREYYCEKRGLSWERDQSPYSKLFNHSLSPGHDDRSRSRSPRDRNSSHSFRKDSCDDDCYDRYEKGQDYDRDGKNYADALVFPSATVVVKGLSQQTTEENLHQMLAEWGPIRHVRVIKERNSDVSLGFAFIDFPSVEAARSMMDGVGEDDLVIDGRKLFFEYSKPTGGAGAPSLAQEGVVKSGCGHGRSALPSDWICPICGCVNFARRVSCFQCNEPRTEDASPADVAPPASTGRKGSESGPTHVLVVRGLDENADEEMLRYEFSKHAPVKDLRLVRDKFTHVFRGFAFLHFHSVEDATKALEATNGTTLEKNGQILRVAYAKSIHGPSSSAPQSSSLAAAAIEAAAFAQQYDAAGWAPKEYNPDVKQLKSASEQNGNKESQMDGPVPQSGFVWDEKSGYYYDSASGFYYDANTGLYYDGNTGAWYTYDHKSQQYVPCIDQDNSKASEGLTSEASKSSNITNYKKAVISAPPTIKLNKKTSLPDAASAALAVEKKEKDKQKELKLASKSSLLANKKKMNNVLAMWKQRNSEGQAVRVVLEDNEQPGLKGDNKQNNPYYGKSMLKLHATTGKEVPSSSSFAIDSPVKPVRVSTSASGTVKGVIRVSGKGVIRADAASGRGVIRADATYSRSCSLDASTLPSTSATSNETNTEVPLIGVVRADTMSGRGVIRADTMSGRGVIRADTSYSRSSGLDASTLPSTSATCNKTNTESPSIGVIGADVVSGRGVIRADASYSRSGLDASTLPSTSATSNETNTEVPSIGVIRADTLSGRGVIRSDTAYSRSYGLDASTLPSTYATSNETNSGAPSTIMPFKTDASALSSYTPHVAAGSGKRRFSETPAQANQFQTTYRDRAAERRNRYGLSYNDVLFDMGDSCKG